MNISIKNMIFNESSKIQQTDFIELIRKRLGIIVHAHQSYELIKTIQNACEKFKCTPDEYYFMLLDCPDQSPLLDHLVAGITVGETYFFRDKQQMELLKSYLLPKLIKEKQKEKSLRIWSAGCASGEEIYTIAMLLRELIPDIANWTIKLLATDINANSLQKALARTYTEWSMRSIPESYKKRFFKKQGKLYHLMKEVSDLVTFDYLNLNDDVYPSLFNGTNSQDLILCRNVLIYFDNESSIQLMHRINASLLLGGYLMLGASDPINIVGTDFIFHHHKGLLFSRPTFEQKQIINIEPVTPVKVVAPVVPLPKKIVPLISRVDSKPAIQKKVTSLSVADQAITLANSGRLEDAIKLCEKAFKVEPANPLNYLTHALTLLELNKVDAAEASLRRALFLDHQFAVSHFQLGLLLLRKNQHAAGLKYLQNALTISETKNPSENVLGAPGLSYHKLAEILRNEMNLYLAAGDNYGR